MTSPQRLLLLFSQCLLLVFTNWIQTSHALPTSTDAAAPTGNGLELPGPISTAMVPTPAPLRPEPTPVSRTNTEPPPCVLTGFMGLVWTRKDARCHSSATAETPTQTGPKTASETPNQTRPDVPVYTERYQWLPDYVSPQPPVPRIKRRDVNGEGEGEGDERVKPETKTKENTISNIDSFRSRLNAVSAALMRISRPRQHDSVVGTRDESRHEPPQPPVPRLKLRDVNVEGEGDERLKPETKTKENIISELDSLRSRIHQLSAALMRIPRPKHHDGVVGTREESRHGPLPHLETTRPHGGGPGGASQTQVFVTVTREVSVQASESGRGKQQEPVGTTMAVMNYPILRREPVMTPRK